jgi:hypothetical protein
MPNFGKFAEAAARLQKTFLDLGSDGRVIGA